MSPEKESPPDMEKAPPVTEAPNPMIAVSTTTVSANATPAADHRWCSAAYFQACGYRRDELIWVNWKSPTGMIAPGFVIPELLDA